MHRPLQETTSSHHSTENSSLQPARPPRRLRRAPAADRGLVAETDRLKLARTYLTHMAKLRPDLVKAGVVHKPSDATIAVMAADFADRHRGGDANLPAFPPGQRLAAAYLRYSSDNSNPRSLDDQLVNVLTKATADGLFIPWSCIFADASITGLDKGRQGYSSLKHLLQRVGRDRVDCVFIDEFSRAGRETLEWFRLSALCRRLGKNVCGATDGFDLKSQHGQSMLHLYGMFSSMFVSQLREKVHRGMAGAERRGTSTGRPPLGYGLADAVDEHGRPLVGGDGKPLRVWRIHEPTMAIVREAYELYVDRRWTAQKIARLFNERKVDGSDGWTSSSVRKLLANPVYVGVRVWNKTRQERDSETGRIVVHKNPSRLWKVQKRPELAVIPQEIWKAARHRLAKTGGKAKARQVSRNADAPTTLLGGTLVCGYCGGEITLARSVTAKDGRRYQQLHCVRGRDRTQGCKLSTSKSVRLVEGAVLGWLEEHVLRDEAVERLVAEANASIDEMAEAPPPDLVPLRDDVAQLQAERARLVNCLAGEDDQNLVVPVKQRLRETQQRLADRQEQLRKSEQKQTKPPRPLSVEDVREDLRALQDLLGGEPAAAGLAVRKLTGPITVTQGHPAGKRRPRPWVLAFRPDLLDGPIGQRGDAGQGLIAKHVHKAMHLIV